jgi:cellulose synthase/poly-beta-1,6-N-acetylglucosamine synthase-like glycosyltransferase
VQTYLNRTQLDIDGVSESQEASEPELPMEIQPTVDAQERALSAFISVAHDQHMLSNMGVRIPSRHGKTFNSSLDATASSTSLESAWHQDVSPLAYVMLLLVAAVLSASLYLDTLEHRSPTEDEKEDAHQTVPTALQHSVLGSALQPQGSQGSCFGLARHSCKFPMGTTGLLEDAEMHTNTAEYGPHDGVGKGGNTWGTKGYGMLARLPGLHTVGGALLLITVFPRFCPRFGLYLQITLLLYGVSKFLVTGLFTTYGLWKIKHQERDGPNHDGETISAADLAGGGSVGSTNLQSVLHCVVIPCYKEAASTVSATLDTLKRQTAASQIVVVLAMEARDKAAVNTAQVLMAQFQDSGLAAIFYTLHELRGSEVPGKSSNENWAFRCCKRWLCDATGYPLEQIVFTTCDADTYFHPQHFEYLSHLFLEADEPHRCVWQGAICAFPNSYDLPALTSVRYIMLSLGYLGQLANGASICGNFPLGVYSMSAKLAHEVGYWDPTVIPEDWHMFFKVNLESSGGSPVRCVPMYTVVGNLGVEGATYWESLKGCYKQSVRWQWGGISMGYLLMQFFQSESPLWKRLSLVAGHYEHHFLLPVVWLSAVTLPALYGPNCVHLIMDTNFLDTSPPQGGHLSCAKGSMTVYELSTILWAFFLLSNWIVVMILEWWYRSLVKDRVHFGRVPQGPPSLGMALTLFLFPVTDVVFHVLPTWHAYLKMLFHTSMVYEVAAKGVKHEEVKMSSEQAQVMKRVEEPSSTGSNFPSTSPSTSRPLAHPGRL